MTEHRAEPPADDGDLSDAEWMVAVQTALAHLDAEPEIADVLLNQTLREHGQPEAT